MSAEMPERIRRTLTATLLLGAVGFAFFVGYWITTGGRWYIVRTPSMGTAAPVGTLLWVKPVAAEDLHVGELVSFRPPGSTEVYSHRIHSIRADGTMTTKGQITAPDPWRIHASNVIGAVQMRWWGIGWLVRAAPILILGGLALWVLARFVADRWRLPLVVCGSALLVSVCVVIYRPLTGAVALSLVPLEDGGRATFVSTGLLPIRLSARDGGHSDMRAGEVGSVVARHTDAKGHLPVGLHPHIPFWFWVAVVLVCFVPALWTSLVGTPPRAAARHRPA